jgi:dipeptidyl-peptidase-4
MAEAITGMAGKFAPANLRQLQWAGKSDMYSYVVSSDTAKKIFLVDPVSLKERVLTDLSTFNNALAGIISKPLTGFPSITFQHSDYFYFMHEHKWIGFSVNGLAISAKILASMPDDADVVEIDTAKSGIAYVSKDNLFVQFAAGNAVQITTDGSPDIVYGKSVHRDEFGISKGLFWSPKGNHLAFYRMDQTMVEAYPIVDWNATPATTRSIKYPMAGRTSHHVIIGVYSKSTGKIVYLNTGEPKDQYLTTVTWSPDEQFIYVSLLNRDQNHLKLYRYEAKTGTLVNTLFEERHPKYVEPQHPLYFPGNDPNVFVWQSQRDGFMHLYLCRNNSEPEALTSGEWLVNEVLGYHQKSGEIYFTASKDNPMQKNVYAVNIRTKKLRSISEVEGTHTAQLSYSGEFLLDQFSNRTIPRAINVVQLADGKQKRILTAVNTLSEYELARVDQVNVKASDGTPLIAKLIYPTNFDPQKKYPCIVYLYNGPHVQLNKETFPFSGNLWYDYLAQHGYVVFVLDGRGSSNRGLAFENATFRQLGTVEMEDQLAGVTYLKSLPFVDATRMGVHGWSFGGFMTTSLMLRHPGVFACGVAGGPVLDWNMYEVMYTERYMDTPQQNPEGYAKSLLLDKVKNLQGKLLLIHGTDDDVVLWQHSLKFVKKSVDEGVQIDYFVYPGHPHNVRGKDRVHLMQKVTDYFDAHLK